MRNISVSERMRGYIAGVRKWLASLSFRTGVGVAVVCVACYVISFAQMLLPISVAAKGALWATFYGLAKASQYTALLILGKAGWQRLRAMFGRGRKSAEENE